MGKSGGGEFFGKGVGGGRNLLGPGAEGRGQRDRTTKPTSTPTMKQPSQKMMVMVQSSMSRLEVWAK